MQNAKNQTSNGGVSKFLNFQNFQKSGSPPTWSFQIYAMIFQARGRYGGCIAITVRENRRFRSCGFSFSFALACCPPACFHCFSQLVRLPQEPGEWLNDACERTSFIILEFISAGVARGPCKRPVSGSSPNRPWTHSYHASKA